MSGDDLIDRFVRALVRDWGRDRRHWRRVIGPVRVYSVETHPHCNWHVTPSGNAAENAAVERIADRLRGEHPIIDA